MICQTCNAGMRNVRSDNRPAWWCGRCGTYTEVVATTQHIESPALVRLCRGYQQNLQPPELTLWQGLGLPEAIGSANAKETANA